MEQPNVEARHGVVVHKILAEEDAAFSLTDDAFRLSSDVGVFNFCRFAGQSAAVLVGANIYGEFFGSGRVSILVRPRLIVAA